jgi:hypothetical protein
VDKCDTHFVAFKRAEAIQRCPPIQSLHSKADVSQQGASSSGISSREAESISQPGVAKKMNEDRDSSVVRNLLYHLYRTCTWEPVALAYNHKELAVLAHLWIGGQ